MTNDDDSSSFLSSTMTTIPTARFRDLSLFVVKIRKSMARSQTRLGLVTAIAIYLPAF